MNKNKVQNGVRLMVDGLIGERERAKCKIIYEDCNRGGVRYTITNKMCWQLL